MVKNLLSSRLLDQKKWLFLFVFNTMVSSQVFAQDDQLLRETISQLDTANLKKSEFKLSKESYLEIYGFNDTAKAVINLYFMKRKSARIIAYSNLGFLAVIRAAGQEQTSPLDPTAQVTYRPWVVPAVVAAGAVTIFSLFRLDAWSLKSLVKTLYTYEKTGILPDRLQRKLKPAHFK